VANVYPSQGIETRLCRESVYGVTPGSPTYKRLNAFGIVLGDTVEIDPFAPPGALVPTVALVNDVYGEGEIEGRLDFNGLVYPFSSLFGDAVITNLGGAPTAYQWQWTWNGRCPNRAVSFVVQSGFADSADVANGFVINELGISGGRADGFEVSGAGFSKALLHGQTLGGLTVARQTLTMTGSPTGGTFTLTFQGQTTAPIAYNATAAVVDAALELLPNIGSGGVTAGGGPLPATPITVDFSPVLAQCGGVTVMTANSALLTPSGTLTPALTTPAADSVVDIPPVPAGAILGRVFLDPTWAALGTTKLLYCYSMDLSIGERMSRVRPINKEQTSDGIIDVAEQEHTLALVLGRNATSDAELAKLQAGTKVFVRTEWEGDTISGANKYLLQVDACLIYTEVGMPDDTDNVSTKEFTGQFAIDPTSGFVCRVTIKNAVATL